MDSGIHSASRSSSGSGSGSCSGSGSGSGSGTSTRFNSESCSCSRYSNYADMIIFFFLNMIIFKDTLILQYIY